MQWVVCASAGTTSLSCCKHDHMVALPQADLALEVQRSLGSAQEVYSAFSRTVNRVIQSGGRRCGAS